MEEEYKLGNTIQEFEELFGNTPFENIEKIKKYIFQNFIPISVIQNKIDELRTKQIEFESDNANRFLIKEFIRKYTEKNDHDYGMFNIMEAISYMTNNEYIARKHVLQELLEERR